MKAFILLFTLTLTFFTHLKATAEPLAPETFLQLEKIFITQLENSTPQPCTYFTESGAYSVVINFDPRAESIPNNALAQTIIEFATNPNTKACTAFVDLENGTFLAKVANQSLSKLETCASVFLKQYKKRIL